MKRLTVSRWRTLTGTIPTQAPMAWQELATLLTNSIEATTKHAVGLWSPASFTGPRKASNVTEVGALVLDFDGGTSLEQVRALSCGLCAILHTTWSHQPGGPRFRLVVQLSRAISPTDFGPVWQWAARRFSADCTGPDPACKDPGRCWLLPSHPRGAEHYEEVLQGDALDVDQILIETPPARSRVALGRPVTASAAARLPPRVEALLRLDGNLRDLWRGKKSSGDTSDSGCDFSCALQLLRRGVPPDVVLAALRLRPRGKLRTERYFQLTVAKARHAHRPRGRR